MSEEPTPIETAIRAACAAGEHERAATLAIEHYGQEILVFLMSQLRGADDAHEVFQDFSEALWQSLPSFEWRCSARTWSYKLARFTAIDFVRKQRKHAVNRPLTRLSQLSEAIDRVRSATAAHRRTDVKDRFQKLREQLPEDDQMLLMLRVDRGLSWLELAEIMVGEQASPDAEQLKTEAARLRKRFQLAKERLRKMMEEEGLLDS